MKRKIILSLIFVSILCTLFTGAVFADWQREDSGKYKYFNTAAGQYVMNNWLQTGNGFYYFDSYGYAVTGWYLINGAYYYFDANGLMQVGFIEFNGNKYYLNPNNGQMVTGWIQTYTDGVLDYYYFDVSNGSLTKGWIQDQNGNEYYLSEVDGSLAVNTTLQIGGTYYTFDSQGKCIAKDQYTFVGDVNGNSSYYSSGVLGNRGSEIVYGVNVGVSPGSGMGVGGTTSFQYEHEQKQPLQAGTTTGPK